MKIRGSPASGLDAAERFGVAASIAVGAVAVLAGVRSAVGAAVVVTYGNLVLRRDAGHGGGVLHLQHGLLRVREHTFDMRRLRGGTLREPLLVRLFGGARLDAVMTGVGGAGEASLLLPPCPKATAEAVLTELIARTRGGARGRCARMARRPPGRRWTRALTVPAVLAAVLVVAGRGRVRCRPGRGRCGRC